MARPARTRKALLRDAEGFYRTGIFEITGGLAELFSTFAVFSVYGNGSSMGYLNSISKRLHQVFDCLLKDVLQVVDEALFSEDHRIAYQQVYCITYEEGRDSGLKAHTDDSDLTINVFLGSPTGYEGAELLLLSPTPEAFGGSGAQVVPFAGILRVEHPGWSREFTRHGD
ncbi:unnamed protein product [Symbiodinium natans]|uniref:Fe2OG dioxygenase domain-containing protein n=1 Tax=Symbiodinium natans TaxID=878477 RepID=A0A812M0U5_9DINO|nr:unnamed protein product [Symbiodinium natans]